MYLYDGTFKSLLILINTLKERPDNIIDKNKYIPNLLEEPIYLKLDKYKNYLPNHILKITYYIFLSNDKNKEMIIYDFVKAYLKYKDKVIYQRNIKCVNDSLKLFKKVGREAHKIKGFLRFKKMKNNFYYAKINPTHNVIEIVSKHFVKRLNENFIIYDENREIYALYYNKKLIFLTKENIINLNLDIDDKEEDIEEMWKSFFNKIAIKERENLKVQKNFMPKKYWKNIIEMEEYNERSN